MSTILKPGDRIRNGSIGKTHTVAQECHIDNNPGVLVETQPNGPVTSQNAVNGATAKSTSVQLGFSAQVLPQGAADEPGNWQSLFC